MLTLLTTRICFRKVYLLLIAFFGAACAPYSLASELDNQASRLAKEFVEFSRELNALEQQVLYPEVDRLALFLQVELDGSYTLESISISLDGKSLTSYVYGEDELRGLRNGGIQRLYQGILARGKHSLTASFNVRGDNEVYLRREKTLRFEHSRQSAANLRLRIKQDRNTRQPAFSIESR